MRVSRTSQSTANNHPIFFFASSVYAGIGSWDMFCVLRCPSDISHGPGVLSLCGATRERVGIIGCSALITQNPQKPEERWSVRNAIGTPLSIRPLRLSFRRVVLVSHIQKGIRLPLCPLPLDQSPAKRPTTSTCRTPRRSSRVLRTQPPAPPP